MCYKLVDDGGGKIVCRSVIHSTTEPGTANLRIDPIEPSSPVAVRNTEPDTMLDELMTHAEFGIPLSNIDMVDPIDSIPTSTKSRPWQEMDQDIHLEHQEDI